MEEIDRRLAFVERNGMKLLGIILFTLVLMSVSSFSGIGYQSTVKLAPMGVTRTGTPTEGGSLVFHLFEGNLQVCFNPLLYPISYLSGNGLVYKNFIRASEFWDYKGQQVAEAVLLYTVFIEFAKNVPYFFAVGSLTILGLGKLGLWKLAGRLLKNLKTTTLHGLSGHVSDNKQARG